MIYMNSFDENAKRYPSLYGISPRLYSATHILIERSKNLAFQAKYIRYMAKPSDYINNNIRHEFAPIYDRLQENTERLKDTLRCPIEWAIDRPGGELIYAMVRQNKPNIVLETGIANGASSFIILSALNKNRKGNLISTEVRKNTGQLVLCDKKRWHTYIGNPKTIFKKALSKLNYIDIFIHDSNHSYSTMLYEYTRVVPKLSKNGIIMSDDVSGNKAFMELSTRIKRRPVLFKLRYREFGLIELNRQ